MALLKSALFALLSLHAIAAVAADEKQPPIANAQYEIPDPPAGAEQPVSPSLDIKVAVDFPDSDFGVKLVNGHATSAHISFINGEVDPISVRMIGGSLWNLAAPKPPATTVVALRNLTTQNYNLQILPGANQTLTYTFATELHPQDLTLLLAAIVMDNKGATFQVEAYNGTVAVVEAPLSIFDPQILFLYVFLLACFAGTCYFIYSTWIKPLFPQQKRRPGASSRKSQPSTSTTASADVPAEVTATGTYDASWIPAQHLQRPEAKRAGSGKVKSRAK